MRLPRDAAVRERRVLPEEEVVAGAFRTRTVAEGRRGWIRPLLPIADARSRYSRLPYGDQALFVRAEAFRRVGGFPDQPLLEDLELSRRLRRAGRIRVDRAVVEVSGRRFLERPLYYPLAINLLPLLYRPRISPERLERRPSVLLYVNRYRVPGAEVPLDFRIAYWPYDKRLNRQPARRRSSSRPRATLRRRSVALARIGSSAGIVPGMNPPRFVPLEFERVAEGEMLARGRAFRAELARRRSVREFSPEPVPRELIELAILTAGSAPSGAHRQPWRFVAVSDPIVQREIRVAAEAEERESYQGRMSAEWLEALRPLGTDWRKPFLEVVPWIVVVFAELWEQRPDGSKVRNYYVKESVGIACGLFLAALHRMGLATLTHTPSPMAFLNRVLDRPANEKPFVLFPIGYPAAGASVPDLRRKGLEEVAIWHERSTPTAGA